MQPLDAERVKEWRHRRMLSQQEVADRAGTSLFTIQRIERGEGNVRPKTGRGLAAALDVPIEELLPKAPASSQPSFNGLLEEERRTAWEAAVDEARHLREAGGARMWKALSEWRASKQREEPYATRRKYLDEMGNLLRDAYGAYLALGNAYVEAAVTQGGSEAPVPSYLQEETRAANDFYVELFGLVRSAGLGIRTGDDAAAAKQATADEAAAEHAQAETRSLRVEEPEAA